MTGHASRVAEKAGFEPKREHVSFIEELPREAAGSATRKGFGWLALARMKRASGEPGLARLDTGLEQPTSVFFC